MTEHLPWVYRPRKFDDWGWIREGADLVAIARGRSDELSYDEHRANKTDPYAEHGARIIKAVNNHEALLEFFKWAMREGPWDGGDLDGGSIQDKAESLGLIVKTQYDAERHGVQSEFETGDDWFEYKPDLRSPVGGSCK